FGASERKTTRARPARSADPCHAVQVESFSCPTIKVLPFPAFIDPTLPGIQPAVSASSRKQVRHDVATLPVPRGSSVLLRIDISTRDSSATISPVGEIDLDTVGLLSASLSDTIAAGANHVVVDFAHVTYIDSAGLGALD